MKNIENWIDFMEGEMSLSDEAEMEMLLTHSAEERLVFYNLCRLRSQIEDLNKPQEALRVQEEASLKNIHEAIMKEVKKIKKVDSRHLKLQAIASLKDQASEDNFSNLVMDS